MLSAPSSSRDASLPQKPAASSTTPAAGPADAPAAPFDSVLAGLTPARNEKANASCKGDRANSKGEQDPADAKAPDNAMTTGGHVWSAPATWLHPADAAATGSEESEDPEAEQPMPAQEEEPAEPDGSIAATIVPVGTPPAPVETSRPVAADSSGKEVVDTGATGRARPHVSFEEDMEGALPDSPGALYSGAAATGSRATQARDSARVDPRESNGSEGARDAEVRADKFSVPTDVSPPSEKATSDAADQPRSASTQSPAQPPAVPKEGGDIARLPKVPVGTQARGVDRADPGVRPTPTLPASAAAPFAARAEKPEPDVGVERVDLLENIFQDIGQQVVSPALKALGIDPAKAGSTMEIVAADPSPLTPDALAPEAEPEVAAASRGAFDRVMQVTDAARPAERSAVNVRLDFGEAGPLNVHIAMRDGRVHTMFRCDSAQLRDTLADAWSHFVQQRDVAALPLAEPVMLPLRASPGSQDSGRQHDNFNQPQSDGQSGRQAGGREEGGAGEFARPLRRQSPAVPASATAPTTRGGSSSHLSAHA